MFIDRESKEFIKWSISLLTDEGFYLSLINKIKTQMIDIYRETDRQELLQQLQAKMTVGAIEHGKPLDDYKAIEDEIQQELLDLLGWNLIYHWKFIKENELNK